VALSGLGGDEAFAGYPRYAGVRLSETCARVPRPLRSAVGALLMRLVPESQTSRDWGSWIRRFVAGADQPLPDRYVDWTRFLGEAELQRLAAPALRERWRIDVAASHRAAFQAARPGDPVDGAIRVDLATYLPDDLLVMADRMTMAHSLELRAPFCDHRVIEATLGLPSTLKMGALRLKRLLKAAFADVLPPEVLAHPKQGFMIPLARWLRTDLGDVMEDLLAPERVRARRLFDPALVESLKREHLAGGRSHGDRLWTLMVLEVWMREYLDRGRLWTLP
jgi:asparagine synthase (glutamine-hydrolysing)